MSGSGATTFGATTFGCAATFGSAAFGSTFGSATFGSATFGSTFGSATFGAAVTFMSATFRSAVPFMSAAWMPFVSAVAFAVAITTMIGFIAAAAVIAASAGIVEAMFAPAVVIAPAGPGTYAQEDAVEEESWPVKAKGRAFVGWVFVVAVGANRWNADFDVNLSSCRRHQDQACKQYCRTEENFESAHM